MPVLKINEELCSGLGYDRRWRQWAKRVSTFENVDLTRFGAFALGKDWLKWDTSAAVNVGDFIVIASEVGSTAHRRYDYRLLRVAQDDSVYTIDLADVYTYLHEQKISNKLLAASQNSTAFAFAVYIKTVLTKEASVVA